MNNNSSGRYGWADSNNPESFGFDSPSILKICKQEKFNKILDAGCGNGALCRLLHREGFEVSGCDADEEGVELARKASNGAIPFKVLSIYDNASLLGQAGFDAVIASQVIEHLFSPGVLISFSNSVLKKGGCLILTTPYHGYLKNLTLSILNKWDSHHTTLWEGGHIKFWSQKTLRKLLEKQNFEFEFFKGIGRFPYLWKSMLMVFRKK